MNKKLYVILNILMIGIVAILLHNFNYVDAREVSGQWVINSSEIIGNVGERETITLDNITATSSAISIAENAEVEFIGIDFVIGSNVSISRIFEVASSAKLTLTDVTITTSKTINYAVYNNGVLKINKMSCAGCTKTVYNNSSVADSIQLIPL